MRSKTAYSGRILFPVCHQAHLMNPSMNSTDSYIIFCAGYDFFSFLIMFRGLYVNKSGRSLFISIETHLTVHDLNSIDSVSFSLQETMLSIILNKHS